MDQNTIGAAKEKLEKIKADIEKELSAIAEKDDKIKGDWNAKFPQFDIAESGSGALEKAADEVEEYNTRLSLEHNLESSLQDINAALIRIETGDYGKCKKCQRDIEAERLTAYPEAKMCQGCEREK